MGRAVSGREFDVVGGCALLVKLGRWVERELKDDIIYPIDWEHLKSQVLISSFGTLHLTHQSSPAVVTLEGGWRALAWHCTLTTYLPDVCIHCNACRSPMHQPHRREPLFVCLTRRASSSLAGEACVARGVRTAAGGGGGRSHAGGYAARAAAFSGRATRLHTAQAPAGAMCRWRCFESIACVSLPGTHADPLSALPAHAVSLPSLNSQRGIWGERV